MSYFKRFMYNALAKYKWTTLFSLILLLVFTACTEFQEPALRNNNIEILLPQDSLSSGIFNQHFYWYPVEGAIGYEVQIARPDFDNTLELVLDTVLAENEFRFTLEPGTYTWRLSAYNNSSASNYQYRTLFIDASLNLSSQMLQLVSPKDNHATNEFSANLKWQALYGADTYRFELFEENGGGTKILSLDLDSLSFKPLLSQEGSYYWRVKAINQESETPFSGRYFKVDTSRPLIPNLLKPVDQVIFNNSENVEFQWSFSQDSGSDITVDLIIARDSLFQNSQIIPNLSVSSFAIDTFSAGNHYWKLRAVDGAGNISAYSSPRSFSIL